MFWRDRGVSLPVMYFPVSVPPEYAVGQADDAEVVARLGDVAFKGSFIQAHVVLDACALRPCDGPRRRPGGDHVTLNCSYPRGNRQHGRGTPNLSAAMQNIVTP